MKLHIGKNFSLPLELVTQTQAILAKRRVGKSYCAAVQAEEMLKAKQQVVIIDPTGAHFGLKSSVDGKSAGFPIAVFGGEHADVPLEENAGEIIASAIVADRFNAIIDLSLFRKGAANRFMCSFLETLYRLNRQAMHLFVDEADLFAPQKPFGDEARTLGAMQDIVRRGGIRGIGCTLISQRPAVVNKDVLTQCEFLTALRLIHPRDIDAVMEWVNVHGDPKMAAKMVESLPALPVGTAWFWNPNLDIFNRVEIRERETFDSGATPKPGEAIKSPKVLAAVDVEKLGKQIAETAAKAKANDPKELKAQVARLRAEVEKLERSKPAVAPAKETVKRIEVLKDGQISRIEKVLESIDKMSSKLVTMGAEVAAAIKLTKQPIPQRPAAVNRPAPASRINRPVPAPHANGDSHDGTLTNPEQRIVDAIAWLESIGVSQPEKTAVAFLAKYTYGSGGFNNPCGALRTKGLINYVPGNRVELTEDGTALAHMPEVALTNEELHSHVLSVLPNPEQRILKPLLETYPNPMEYERLAELSGYANGSGGFNNPRGRLRTLGLIEYVGGAARARDIFFPNQ
jgi:uncharacterized protein